MRSKTNIARANKAKGRNGQKEFQKLLLEAFPSLEPDDCRSNPMGAPGSDILLSPAARKLIPWAIEVKRGKAFNIVKANKQAEDEKNGPYEPVAFGRYDDDKQWYACIKLEYLFELMKRV
jgi:hypothetical protein